MGTDELNLQTDKVLQHTGSCRLYFLFVGLVSRNNMAGSAKRFYDLSTKLLSGETLKFSALQGKVVLIENVASL